MMMKFRDVPDCVSSAMSDVTLGSSSSSMKLKGPIGEGKMMKVICLQQSNGSFKLDGTISKILDSSLDDIIKGEIDIHFSILFSSIIDKSLFIF